MKHSKELERNIYDFFRAMDDLGGLAEQIAARPKQENGYWLKDFELMKQKALEIQQADIKKDRQKLNRKVVGYLKEVNRLKERGRVLVESIGELLNELKGLQVKQFTSSELQGFKERTEIGKGAYGSVYKALCPNNNLVAVRVLNETDITFCEETLTAVVRTMGRTSHRNLIKLRGFCFTEKMKAFVYEYMEKGSLDQYLYYNQSSKGIEWVKFYRIATEIAWGLYYLHDCLDSQVVHGNVKPANVLLDSNLCPKLTDFALPKVMNRVAINVISTGHNETHGFDAPEMRDPEFRVTYQCDVYSFGMMLFEILGRRKNLTGGKWFPKQVAEMIQKLELDQLLNDCGIYEEEDRKKAKVLCIVALQCTQNKAESRPTMITVGMMLEGKIEVTPDMFKCSTHIDNFLLPIGLTNHPRNLKRQLEFD